MVYLNYLNTYIVAPVTTKHFRRFLGNPFSAAVYRNLYLTLFPSDKSPNWDCTRIKGSMPSLQLQLETLFGEKNTSLKLV